MNHTHDLTRWQHGHDFGTAARAEGSTPYEKVAQLMSEAARHGLTRIGFVTDPSMNRYTFFSTTQPASAPCVSQPHFDPRSIR